MGSEFTERTSQRPKKGLCGPAQSAPLSLTSTPITLQPSHTYSCCSHLAASGSLSIQTRCQAPEES